MAQTGTLSSNAGEGCIGGDHFSLVKEFQAMILEVRDSRLPYLRMLSHIIRAAKLTRTFPSAHSNEVTVLKASESIKC